jgi:hypothetical protein
MKPKTNAETNDNKSVTLSALKASLSEFEPSSDLRIDKTSERETLVKVITVDEVDFQGCFSVLDQSWINYRATSTFEVLSDQTTEVAKLANVINDEMLFGAFICSIPDEGQMCRVVYSHTMLVSSAELTTDQIHNFNLASLSQLDHWLPLLKTVATTRRTCDQTWGEFLASIENNENELARLCKFTLINLLS